MKLLHTRHNVILAEMDDDGCGDHRDISGDAIA